MKVTLANVAFCSVLLLSVLAGAGSASAQSSSSGCDSGHCYSGPVRHHTVHYVRPVYGHVQYGHRGYGYDPAFGRAALIRAAATANVLNASARTQHLHADRLEMENSVAFLATRLERKQINNQSRFGHLHARGEQVRQEKRAAVRLVSSRAPRRPVDPVTGQVAWPILLQSSYYEKARGPVDLVFHQRSVVGRINPDYFLPMRDWIERIEKELKANVAYYEKRDYLEAKAFLRSLIEEARVEITPAHSQSQLAAR
ncbi:hypothetical protein Mal15_09320 [Stieleria maiorica]|uniref:Uncharacterized protein n=1 Tax=Stieleria maiorica TaxID=2795974 RepID=A0A5B9M700_9BACT|nr:hypothetical protein [Stieleria maiorica]QEF96902.1 hypothetical protein Mal15_09320 [Stieleria maiorica]